MHRPLAAVLCALVLAGCSARGADALPLPSVTPAAVAPSPSLAAGHAPAQTYQVGTRTLQLRHGDRPLPTTVYYPKTGLGRFPVVVFGHGLGGAPTAYADLLKRWARAGFVVAAPAFPHTRFGARQFDFMDVPNQPGDVVAVLDGLAALPAADALRRILDPTRAVAAGHSAGGITAVGVFTEDGPEGRDKRFAGGIVLAGNALGVGQTFSDDPASMLFIHAADDPVVPLWTGQAVFDALTWPRAFLRLPGKEHSAPFVSQRSKQFAVVAATTVDFLRWVLYRDAAARTRVAKVRGITSHL